VNEKTYPEAGASPAILKISNKTNGDEFIAELHGLHLQISSPKTTRILSLKHRRKVGLPSLMQATGIEF